MVDPGTILTFMSIIKVGMDIIDRIRGSAKKAPKELPPASVSMFREKVASDVGQIAAERLRSDSEIRQGLSLMAQALSDWQISSTPLCPLVLRKTFAFGTEEKNIGLLPGNHDEAFIERLICNGSLGLIRDQEIIRDSSFLFSNHLPETRLSTFGDSMGENTPGITSTSMVASTLTAELSMGLREVPWIGTF